MIAFIKRLLAYQLYLYYKLYEIEIKYPRFSIWKLGYPARLHRANILLRKIDRIRTAAQQQQLQQQLQQQKLRRLQLNLCHTLFLSLPISLPPIFSWNLLSSSFLSFFPLSLLHQVL